MSNSPNPFLEEFLSDAPADESAEPAPPSADASALYDEVVRVLQGVFDPEIPVNIYDLGLIYNIDVDDNGFVRVEMTLTTPGCPVAQTFPGTVEYTVESVPGVSGAEVELVWDPPWTQDRMSEAARLQLGLL